MNDDTPKPMLNTPVQSPSKTAEQFAQNVIGRMDRARDAHTEVNRMFAELPAAEQERLEKFKQVRMGQVSEKVRRTDSESGCQTLLKLKFRSM